MDDARRRRRTEDLYRQILRLPVHGHADLRSCAGLPENGIYFVFEKGEVACLDGMPVDRIVRVGINKTARLPERMRQHYERTRRQSVFRWHVGGALLRFEDPSHPSLPTWSMKKGPKLPGIESGLVTPYLKGAFRFRCLRADCLVERRCLEKGCIALLAQYPLGGPSAQWLGNAAPSGKVRDHGLWNADFVHETPLSAQQQCRVEQLTDEWLQHQGLQPRR